MAGSFLRRVISFPCSTNAPVLSWICNFCSEASRILEPDNRANSISVSDKLNNGGSDQTFSSANRSSTIHLSPLLSTGKDNLEGLKIELVDSDLWQVSTGLAHAWRATDVTKETLDSLEKMDVGDGNSPPNVGYLLDFDAIEDMRLHGNLFYKLDRDSREFEEYNIRFLGKRSLKKKEKKDTETKLGKEKIKQDKINLTSPVRSSELVVIPKSHSPVEEISDFCGEGKKRQRTPTYNQLTDPYHQPFCLDIYISKSSVRACIVHRVTSKVVAVAHSISKDMKHDLVSTKDSNACVAVGGVLAQRAIADDIHNLVYTPRKGEKIEGKLKIVLQSVIDNGIDVKVKIKQKKPVNRIQRDVDIPVGVIPGTQKILRLAA